MDLENLLTRANANIPNFAGLKLTTPKLSDVSICILYMEEKPLTLFYGCDEVCIRCNNINLAHYNFYTAFCLTLSWKKSLSYRNQYTDLLCKSMHWFLYDRDLRYERVKSKVSLSSENLGGHSLYPRSTPMSYSVVFIVNFEPISHIVPVDPLLKGKCPLVQILFQN